ncbi:tetratricopeptide repeat protein [Streptomyces sp. HU2014]|uniref:AfsR/SARP family transcriptional regulator n=1 Tax=Streptomyces sp. HU2014 TaxID=2939414 RepID=UPI00200BDD75|nr:BTAD domain-containing putative transcriptional regulator [Streptomyces sp. HU2014]UQI46421.1 tetratricopeptide repeat protein [Streptomyces sp. HU2014]
MTDTASDAPGRPRLLFSVLGPVRARRGAELLHTGSPQQRALLAALLLRGGRTATAAELVDALWGEEPPHAALAALRTYASRLRKVFGPDADALVSESGGYAIRVGEGCLDTDRAEHLATDAEKARATGDRPRARDLINEALDLWDGEPLAGLPGPFAETQRTRLEEWRLTLLESRLDLDLEVGAHAEAVSELTALTAAHPLRERLRELLMLALYRSGRQAEALAVYADTRRLLADELGVDPCPELSELQQRILQADTDLAAVPDPSQGYACPFVRPAQLPARVAHFTGRAGLAAGLRAQLTGPRGGAPAVSAIAGIGGVGKTSLAVHVAHAVRHHFPDGQLYADLQGGGPGPAEPDAVLGAFLRAMGTADSAIPGNAEERAALYRSFLADRRVLVVLDNARDAAQVRPLLPGAEGCAALVTSRVRLFDLENVRLVDLDVMDPGEALALFTGIVGAERVGVEREAALDTVAACGFLPLALRIAASRLAARPTWTVAHLARRLADERRRLDELHAGDLAVEATFDLGYHHLEHGQARAFRLLGLPDGPDLSLPAAAALLDLDPDAAEDVLESLVDTSLLESTTPGRYRLHDLLRLYARARAEREEPPAERDAAMSRLLDFYLATAARAYAVDRPGDRLGTHLEPVPVPGLTFPGSRAATDWLLTEVSCLLACVRQQASGDTLRRSVDLLFVVKDLAESGMGRRLYGQVAAAVLTAARDAGDPRAEGRAHTILAYHHGLTARFARAEEHARQAVRLGTATADPLALCQASNLRGSLATWLKRPEEAERHLATALRGFRADGNLPGEASALSNLSRAHLDMGRPALAAELAGRALARYEAAGPSWRRANALYAYGIALTESGRPEEAVRSLADALAVFQAGRQRWWEGMTAWRLTVAHLAAGDPAAAARHADLALTVLRDLGDDLRSAHVLTLLGRALARIGQEGRARACWRDALAAYERLGAAERSEVRELLAERSSR